MADSLDSIERIEHWTTEQRVKRSHRSAREKDKPFSSVLRDEMEEEHRRKRQEQEQEKNEPVQDEVILDLAANEDDNADADTQDDQSDESNESDETDSSDDREPPSHIDLKA